jgi:mitochondrial fission process protein 1
VAIAYVLVDTGDKAKKQYDKPEILGGGVRPAFVAAGDTLLWQMFASVIIPGLTINRICWATGQGLKVMKFPRSPARLWAPTIIGLASIPLIIHPIDNFVHMLMDKSYRKYVR